MGAQSLNSSLPMLNTANELAREHRVALEKVRRTLGRRTPCGTTPTFRIHDVAAPATTVEPATLRINTTAPIPGIIRHHPSRTRPRPNHFHRLLPRLNIATFVQISRFLSRPVNRRRSRHQVLVCNPAGEAQRLRFAICCLDRHELCATKRVFRATAPGL
ncbi:hypothetical protein BDZ89DRAFT_96329 [Hymenopellis radicata]|nr:hypothetical protein BDZ89DRAFT_96329 [Hymenopellis radicata]